jgi:hypothetical protein
MIPIPLGLVSSLAISPPQVSNHMPRVKAVTVFRVIPSAMDMLQAIQNMWQSIQDLHTKLDHINANTNGVVSYPSCITWQMASEN